MENENKFSFLAPNKIDIFHLNYIFVCVYIDVCVLLNILPIICFIFLLLWYMEVEVEKKLCFSFLLPRDRGAKGKCGKLKFNVLLSLCRKQNRGFCIIMTHFVEIKGPLKR